MQHLSRIVLLMLFLLPAGTAAGQPAGESEQLKIAALEALSSAPPERALPIVTRVLRGDYSDEVKERALFVLSMIDLPEAQTLLLDTARAGSGKLKLEAIRMLGINGDPDLLAGLGALYESGDEETREAVLEAYLIAGDAEAVYALATAAKTDEDFAAAVEVLGAMGAREQLRKLRNRAGDSEQLIEAYAISGDVDILRELAVDGSDPQRQLHALRALGIVGDDSVKPFLVEAYRGAASDEIREAALEALMIAGDDEGLLTLFRESRDPAQKRELLEMLVAMGSDAVWDEIDATLGQ